MWLWVRHGTGGGVCDINVAFFSPLQTRMKINNLSLTPYYPFNSFTTIAGQADNPTGAGNYCSTANVTTVTNRGMPLRPVVHSEQRKWILLVPSGEQ